MPSVWWCTKEIWPLSSCLLPFDVNRKKLSQKKFLCRNYSFFSNSVWWVFQPDSRQISVNYRRQNTTWESWLLKRFQAKRKYFFFVKLNDHHCISNTQDFLIIKVSFILNICTNFDTWYYWGRISEIDAHLLMNWMADDFFLTSNDF